MGVTGTGKSTFIEKVTGLSTGVGHGIESETSKVMIYKTTMGGKEVWFLDTPGFDDTYLRDTEVLEEITNALAEQRLHRRKVNGVVYLHSILENRMRGSALKNLRMMLELAGKDGRLRNVALVTTMWDRLASKDEGVKTEQMFKAKFWNEMISFGASVGRIEDHTDRKEYVRIVEQIMKNNGVILQIQEETVDQELPLGETSAGKVILDYVNKLSKKLDQELAQLNEDLRQAREKADQEAKLMQELLQEEKKKLQEEIQLASQDRANLQKTLSDLAQENKRMADLLDLLKLDNAESDRREKERDKNKADKNTAPVGPNIGQNTPTMSFAHELYQTLDRANYYTGRFSDVTFLPADTNSLVTGTDKGYLQRWDIITGTPQESASISDRIVMLAPASDGKSVWFVDGRCMVSRWLLGSSTMPTYGVSTGFLNNSYNVAVSPDGKLLVGHDQLWYIPTGRQLGTMEGGYWPAAFSPDSSLVAAGCKTPRAPLAIWDTATCTLQKEIIGHSSYVTDVQFTPDGKLVVSASDDHTVRLWDWANNRMHSIIADSAHPINALAIAPNGRLLAYASAKAEKAWIWDIASSSRRAEITGYLGLGSRGIAFSQDSQLLAVTVIERPPGVSSYVAVKIWRLSYD
jgi:hypothetical protein